MQIHELKIKSKKARKRVGRGGKRGTYSGRGMKGQKARSGGNVDPLFEGGRTTIIDKFKKVRGFKSINPKKNVVNLDTLEKKFKDGDIVDKKTLLEAGVVQKSKAGNGIKILGSGSIKKKITIDKEISVSESAKKAIEKAGGKVGGAAKKVASKKENPSKAETGDKPKKKTTKK